jgi:hypothetical protein
MTDIYDQHAAAFHSVMAFAIVKDGQQCGKIAFKFPKDGAGRLYAYVHWHGVPMVRGYAGGYGYDKKSVALANAAAKITGEGWTPDWQAAFVAAIAKDDGRDFDRNLRDAGFELYQAV